MNRRGFLLSGAVTITAGAARAQSLRGLRALPSSPRPFAFFNQQGGLTDQLTAADRAEALKDSAAPAGPPGRWFTRAALPVPTSEMGGGAAWDGRLHVLGGWISHAEHSIYDPKDDRWFQAAPLPRPGNHIPITALDGRVYTLGGMGGPNRDPFVDAFAYEINQDRWVSIAPLPRPRGAGGAEVLGGRIHLVGGADSRDKERASVPWHEAYDPKGDRWEVLSPLPGGRDHLGVVAYQGRLYVSGGRFNSSVFNSDLHHVYLPDRDAWQPLAPMPEPRSAHGYVVYRDRLFAMGGEGNVVVDGKPDPKVYAQMESYDPTINSWQHHAPMPTPRHGPAAATINDAIYVVAGGPIAGGAMQAANNEAFTLA